MIHNDLFRQICLGVTAAVFILIAFRALMAPEKLATGLGYTLRAPNGYSEVFAVYVGIWLATAALALLAVLRVKEAVFGDLVALFVLAQPFGRAIAMFKWGPPQGSLLIMLIVEIVGGIILLAVRPS